MKFYLPRDINNNNSYYYHSASNIIIEHLTSSTIITLPITMNDEIEKDNDAINQLTSGVKA